MPPRIECPFESRSFVERRNVLTLQILRDGEVFGLIVGQFTDNREYFFQVGINCRAITPIAVYDLEHAVLRRSYTDRLKDTDVPDVLGQFNDSGFQFVEIRSRILWVGDDLVDVYQHGRH